MRSDWTLYKKLSNNSLLFCQIVSLWSGGGYTYTTLSDLSNTASYEQCDNGCGTTTYRCKSGYTYSNGKCVPVPVTPVCNKGEYASKTACETNHPDTICTQNSSTKCWIGKCDTKNYKYYYESKEACYEGYQDVCYDCNYQPCEQEDEDSNCWFISCEKIGFYNRESDCQSKSPTGNCTFDAGLGCYMPAAEAKTYIVYVHNQGFNCRSDNIGAGAETSCDYKRTVYCTTTLYGNIPCPNNISVDVISSGQEHSQRFGHRHENCIDKYSDISVSNGSTWHEEEFEEQWDNESSFTKMEWDTQTTVINGQKYPLKTNYECKETEVVQNGDTYKVVCSMPTCKSIGYQSTKCSTGYTETDYKQLFWDDCYKCEKQCTPTCTSETNCQYGSKTESDGCGGTCTVCYPACKPGYWYGKSNATLNCYVRPITGYLKQIGNPNCLKCICNGSQLDPATGMLMQCAYI